MHARFSLEIDLPHALGVPLQGHGHPTGHIAPDLDLGSARCRHSDSYTIRHTNYRDVAVAFAREMSGRVVRTRPRFACRPTMRPRRGAPLHAERQARLPG